jgi:hypothetical protein
MTPYLTSPHRALTISESTRGRIDHFVETGFRPTAVDFVLPTAKRLNAGDLPGWVWCGRGQLWVNAFRPTGFVMSERDTVDDAYEIIVYD